MAQFIKKRYCWFIFE